MIPATVRRRISLETGSRHTTWREDAAERRAVISFLFCDLWRLRISEPVAGSAQPWRARAWIEVTNSLLCRGPHARIDRAGLRGRRGEGRDGRPPASRVWRRLGVGAHQLQLYRQLGAVNGRDRESHGLMAR